MDHPSSVVRSVRCLFITSLTFIGLLSFTGRASASMTKAAPGTHAASGTVKAPTPPSTDKPDTPGGTIRLLDRLGDARIESPLTELEAAKDLGDLVDPALDLLLIEGFEDFAWEFWGWARSPGARIVPRGEGAALELDLSVNTDLGWTLPVREGAYYRFERSVQVEGTPFCDLYVVESTREFEEGPPSAREHRLAGRGSALKIHSLPLQDEAHAGDAWQTGSLSFFPTPRTRSLAVVFRPRTGADGDSTVGAMRFDDVQLEEVVPSRRERMRLFKGAHVDRDEDEALGMRKAGRLLPLPSAREARDGEPAESNYSWRRALYAPPTTEVAFDVDFPEGARLRLATGIAGESPAGSAARFQVELRPAGSEGSEERLLDVVRTTRTDDWHWGEVDLDLSAWAGRRGTLVLRTLAEKGDPHALRGSPRIETSGSDAHPLLILIAVDTLRADRLSSYGYERDTTPALDRLASDGVRFDQARSNCNWTCPSFASIFTGLVPTRHGVSSYGPATPLPDELTTLAEHFQAEGWATRSIAYKPPLYDGNYEQGFDQSFNIPRDVIRGEENMKRALEWLEEQRGAPSFLFLHFNDPHQPFVHPEPIDRDFGSATVGYGGDVPDASNTDAHARFADLYDGAVAYVDSCIGGFLHALRERDLYDRASIVFVADHGEALWEHGRFGHGGAALYDEVVRVPLIVKPPAESFRPGRVVTAEVSGFDVMPTLLELAGLGTPEGLDALSLLPLIRGDRSTLDRPVVTHSSGNGIALVHGGHKLVLEPGGGPEMLFDLKADPGETEDLSESRPAELARLRSLAIAYFLEHRPGNYLLVHTGEEGPSELEVGTTHLRVLVGPAPTATRREGRLVGTADLAADAWFLFQVEGADADSVEVSGIEVRGPAQGFEAWTPGSLGGLEGPGVWRVHGPRSSVPRETEWIRWTRSCWTNCAP